jgi:L-seryl-tRNA(Ser) seleniumtransferase
LADREITHVLRTLPPVQRLLELARASGARWPHAALAEALRAELAAVRNALLASDPAPVPDDAAILARAEASLSAASGLVLRRVLNATGIVVHTNLGRAPLAAEAVEAATQAALNGCNLEFDLETGRRGARAGGVETLLRTLTGAEAGLAVNNNAAAMLLALSALAGAGAFGNGDGGEVIVSRGELVEIGGGFRIPDIIQQGGARLVEVGSTNKTRLSDYAAAVTPRTKMLLKVHQSNFAMVGFTEATSLAELATLARERGLLLMDDLGSGTLAPLPNGLAMLEPTVAQSIAEGSDIVAFSGDKLLGGPQAGLLVGRAVAIDTLRRHPFLRALRLDKMTLAALEATLRLHTDPDHARQTVPVLRMLAQTESALQDRAERLRALLATHCQAPNLTATVERSVGHAGGGALPGQDLPSRAVALRIQGLSADALARRLRAQRPAVAGRIHAGMLLLDVLTLSDDDLPCIADAVRNAAA